MKMTAGKKIAICALSAFYFVSTCHCSLVTQSVHYNDGAQKLTAYLAYDDQIATETDKKPGVLIIPDWNGADDYEFERARMIALDLGYVAVVADIFGAVYSFPEDMSTMIEESGRYRNDIPLYVGRMEAGLNELRNLPFVDASNVAVIGYCFGGTGAINLGISGADVLGIVSFHGGLTTRAEASAVSNITAKILILSGGSDDASSSIEQIENELNNASTTWEISRYSGVGHYFTKWGPEVGFGEQGYNARADYRSWNSMKLFLDEIFNDAINPIQPPSLNVSSPYVVESVPYNDGDKQLTGYLAYNSDLTSSEKRPGVIIVPDWDGIGEYEQKRAILLAEMGYVAMVADIYGESFTFPQEFAKIMNATNTYRTNIPLFNGRMNAAVEKLRENTFVDGSKIGAIGYCFGGTGVINLAISGADISGIVSFHGGLTVRAAASMSSNITAKMLILSGGSSDAPSSIEQLEAELNDARAHWEISRYSGVAHAFTKWGPEIIRNGGGYNSRADYRSWNSMGAFFEEIFTGKGLNGTMRTQIDSAGLDEDITQPENGEKKESIAVHPDQDQDPGQDQDQYQRDQSAATMNRTLPFLSVLFFFLNIVIVVV